MTTYPLSEPATIHLVDASGDMTADVIGQGTLEDCVELVAGLSADRRKAITVHMDDLDLQFGPKDVGDLLNFLHNEDAGLSNNEIIEIKNNEP